MAISFINNELLDVLPGILFLAVVWWVTIPGFAGFLREFRFYQKKSWNLSEDSGEAIFQQDAMERKFSFLPLGALKLWYHASRIVMACAMFPLAAGIVRRFM